MALIVTSEIVKVNEYNEALQQAAAQRPFITATDVQTVTKQETVVEPIQNNDTGVPLVHSKRKAAGKSQYLHDMFTV
jgi:hypothetical protein